MERERWFPPSLRKHTADCCDECRGESNPLFRAVLADDLKELKSLVKAGHSVNIENAEGKSLLNFVMRRNRVEIFDYLLSLDEIDVNFRDVWGQIPLLYLAGYCFNEYFARGLLEKNANIHVIDNSGSTFLHLAAQCEGDDILSVGQLIIERGANINQQEEYGMTPLYVACKHGRFDWACMLLYYGADATIATERGILPLAIESENSFEEELQLKEILLNYTFDQDKVTLTLSCLVPAMMVNTDLFSKIVDNISDVDYDFFDLQFIVDHLILVEAKHWKLFMEKFGHVVKEMIEDFSLLDSLITIALEVGMEKLEGIIDIFLNSDLVADFVQSSFPRDPTISGLLKIFAGKYQPVDEEDFTKIICVMLTYGLTVTSIDLDSVYQHFGNCELFQILLHMDITMKTNDNDTQSMAVLYYNPFLTIDDLLVDESIYSILLDYYNNYKLKEFVAANSNEKEVLQKLKKLPQVPLLIELSRDAARKYIVNNFNIKNSVQFYTILHWLPIGEMNKRIIALDKKLY